MQISDKIEEAEKKNTPEGRVWITAKELSKRWPYEESTLAVWRHRGEGPPYEKHKGKVIYYLDDIVTYERTNFIRVEPKKP
jgi:hypothetical protein